MKDERRPICEVVAESIERLIIDGVLKVGQPLPSERRLCEKLGFSRSALREGLTVLRGRGIIETAQGRDSRVARLNRVQDTSPLSICSVRSRERCTICSTFAHYWRANRQGWRQRWERRLILL